MSAIITLIAKKTLKDKAIKNINTVNPYEEEIPVVDRQGRPTGKVKTQKRGFPTGLTDHDTRVLKKVRRRAYRLDMSLFNCCGIRFGWSSVIGIVPVIGDVIDAILAMMLVRTAGQIEEGLPWVLQSRMLINIALDFGIGLIPFVGDVADAVFRANTRNAWLLEVYLAKKAATMASSTGQAIPDTQPLPSASEVKNKSGTSGGVIVDDRTQHNTAAENNTMSSVNNAGHHGTSQQSQVHPAVPAPSKSRRN